jgi:hypothetical protein
MIYAVMQDMEFPDLGEWRFEAIDQKSGDIYIAVFSGPNAEQRAREYSAWQQSSVRVRAA